MGWTFNPFTGKLDYFTAGGVGPPGAGPYPASDVTPGTFNSTYAPSGDYIFPAKLGIGSAAAVEMVSWGSCLTVSETYDLAVTPFPMGIVVADTIAGTLSEDSLYVGIDVYTVDSTIDLNGHTLEWCGVDVFYAPFYPTLTVYGIQSGINNHQAVVMSEARVFSGELYNIDPGGTVTLGIVYDARFSHAGTIVDSFLYRGYYDVAYYGPGTFTNKWGIWIDGEDKNYLSGMLGLGVDPFNTLGSGALFCIDGVNPSLQLSDSQYSATHHPEIQLKAYGTDAEWLAFGGYYDSTNKWRSAGTNWPSMYVWYRNNDHFGLFWGSAAYGAEITNFSQILRIYTNSGASTWVIGEIRGSSSYAPRWWGDNPTCATLELTSVYGGVLICSTEVDGYPGVAVGMSTAHDSGYIAFDAVYAPGYGWQSCDPGSNFIIQKDSDTLKFKYDTGIVITGPGNDIIPWHLAMAITSEGKIGFGTETVPHAGIGSAKLAIEGEDGSVNGPHVQFTTPNDNYPILQVMPWAHGTTFIGMDCYYDGTYRSSHIGYLAAILKSGSRLDFLLNDNGISPPNAIGNWDRDLYLDANNSLSYELQQDGLPTWSLFSYAHDDVYLYFDGYYSGATKASDTSSYIIGKHADKLYIYGGVGFTPGSVYTPNAMLTFDAATNNITIGSGAAGIDYTLTFDGETYDGTLTWMEDEMTFVFNRDIYVGTDDVGQGLVGLYGSASKYGGNIIFYVPVASHAIIDYWRIRSYYDYMQIGPNTLPDMIRLDASLDVRMTADVYIYGRTANALTIGNGAAGVDYTLTFNGETNDGVITWMEDEDAFTMACGLGLDAGAILNWGATLGSTGYGFCDVAGVMKYKDSGGSWIAFNSLGGGGGAWTSAGGITYLATETDEVRIGAASGGTYNGNTYIITDDQYPSVNFRTGTTISSRIYADVSGNDLYVDAEGTIVLRDYASGTPVNLVTFKDWPNVLDISKDLDLSVSGGNTLYMNIQLLNAISSMSKTVRGFYLSLNDQRPSGNALFCYGSSYDLTMVHTVTSVEGFRNNIYQSALATGNITAMYGIRQILSAQETTGTYSITTLYGEYVSVSVSSGAKVGTSYLFYGVASDTAVGITASWGIYLTGELKNYLSGSLLLGVSKYLNFGLTEGSSGYGIRDNATKIEYKDSGGSWIPFNGIGGGGGDIAMSMYEPDSDETITANKSAVIAGYYQIQPNRVLEIAAMGIMEIL